MKKTNHFQLSGILKPLLLCCGMVLLSTVCHADPDLSGAFDFMLFYLPGFLLLVLTLLFMYLAHRYGHTFLYISVFIFAILNAIFAFAIHNALAKPYLNSDEKAAYPIWMMLSSLLSLLAAGFTFHRIFSAPKTKKDTGQKN